MAVLYFMYSIRNKHSFLLSLLKS